MEHEEQQIIIRAQEGDHRAFRELVDQFKRPMFKFALELTGDRDEADDLSQQTFIKAYKGLHRYKAQSKIISWLYRIMVNAHIDNRRKQDARGGWNQASTGSDNYQSTEPFVATAAEHNPESSLDAEHMRAAIDRAINALAPKQRSVFIMRHYHDLPLKEIAGILNISTGTVKSQLFRALQRLQKELAIFKPELGIKESS